MKPKTRQTLIGVVGMTIVALAALHEGYNGQVAIAYMGGITAQTAPEVADRLPVSFGGGG